MEFKKTRPFYTWLSSPLLLNASKKLLCMRAAVMEQLEQMAVFTPDALWVLGVSEYL
jgi:hypothetical protein